jgi:hypothetical protein
MKVDWYLQNRYEDSSMASRTLVQRLFIIPLGRLLSSIAHFPGYLHLAISSRGVQFVAILRRLSVTSFMEFLKEKREALDFPGDEYLWFLYLPIYLFIIIPIVALVESLTSIAATSEIPNDASHVPTFYAPVPHVDVDDLILFAVVLPLVACIFGAMHLIAWQFRFPSHVEQLLWRIGSLTITALPLLVLTIFLCKLILDLIAYIREKLHAEFGISFPDLNISIPRNMEKVVDNILGSIAFSFVSASLVGYMLARLLLLTEAIVLLRQQPESAFYAISWSYFLPHV